MNISDRLKLFIETKGITQYRLAKDSNLGQATVSHIFIKNQPVKSDTLEKILLAYPELNGDWLLTGRGEMFLDAPTSESDV